MPLHARDLLKKTQYHRKFKEDDIKTTCHHVSILSDFGKPHISRDIYIWI